MMKTALPDLSHNIPINKTALKVVIMNGFSEEIKIPAGYKHYKVCPKLRFKDKHLKIDPSFKDYTETRFGRFTVVGMATEYPKSFRRLAVADEEDGYKIVNEERPNHGNCRWVVKCSCGCFEIRKTKVIKKADPQERCFVCKQLIFSVCTNFYNTYGRKPTNEEIGTYL